MCSTSPRILARMSHRLTLIPGDGIGPEVTDAVIRILAASGVSIDWDRHDAGLARGREDGHRRCPRRSSTSIARNRVALKGPVTTPVGEGFTSVNVGLRKALDLYVNLRPVTKSSGCVSRFETSISSSSARTPRISTPASSTSSSRCRRESEDHHRASRRRASRNLRSSTRGGTAARRSPRSTKPTS